MSAECGVCGADLVYGAGSETYCEPCDLRAEVERLQHILMQDTVPDEFTKTHDELRHEVERLTAERDAYKWAAKGEHNEVERLRGDVEEARAEVKRLQGIISAASTPIINNGLRSSGCGRLSKQRST